MTQTERLIVSNDWITLLLVGCVILYAVAKLFYPKRFQEFVQLPITNKYFLVQGRNEQIPHPFNILLFVSQLLNVSLFIYLFFERFQPEATSQNPYLFIQILTVISVFVLMKFFIEKIISSVFAIDDVIHSYLYHKLTYRNLISLLFFMVNILLVYTLEPTKGWFLLFVVIVVAANLIALFYSYKTYANVIFGNFFYFILYLCTLEISPYILLYKLAV
ncbi:MAG: DUF4271 domain-containing protein [Flavobacteriaceae bacterium]|nr:DUF4271 domain-containing protein [Flavobacteriaceae bacterium]